MSSDRLRSLVEAHRDRTFRCAYRILGHHEDALDVLQEASLKLYEHLDRVPDDRAGAWLCRVATNRALDLVRRRDPLRQAHSVDRVSAAVEGEGDAGETSQRVTAALANLSPRQAEIISLRIHEGLSFAAVARAIGISEGATKVHFRRGLDSLRRRLAGLHPERPHTGSGTAAGTRNRKDQKGQS